VRRQILSCLAALFCLALIYGHRHALGAAVRVYSELSSGGFRVEYFENDLYANMLAMRSERFLVKDYGEGRPALGVSRKSFASRWEGWLRVPETTEYGFFLQSLGGSRFYIDDDLVLDHSHAKDWFRGMHGAAQLTSGVYRIRLEHVKSSGRSAVRLRWVGGPIPANTVMGVPYVTKEHP
jgi:hypothetical protein